MDAPEWDKKTIISKAAHMAVGGGMHGDYYEFGVFEGRSICSAFWAFKWAYESILGDYDFLMDNRNLKRISDEWSKMKFYGYDSFEGLPEPKGHDLGGPFLKGNYSCPKDRVREVLSDHNVDSRKIVLVKGWFKEIDKTEIGNIRKASVIHIDCDLYESTVDALEICRHILQDGTIIIFDDWFQFRSSPFKGEQRAFFEWSNTLEDYYTFTEYYREDIWRNSFITNWKYEHRYIVKLLPDLAREFESIYPNLCMLLILIIPMIQNSDGCILSLFYENLNQSSLREKTKNLILRSFREAVLNCHVDQKLAQYKRKASGLLQSNLVEIFFPTDRTPGRKRKWLPDKEEKWLPRYRIDEIYFLREILHELFQKLRSEERDKYTWNEEGYLKRALRHKKMSISRGIRIVGYQNFGFASSTSLIVDSYCCNISYEVRETSWTTCNSKAFASSSKVYTWLEKKLENLPNANADF